MVSKRERITVDITGIKEKLLEQISDPNVSIGSLVRSAALTAVEFWEAVDKLGLPRPKPGKMQEWLMAIQSNNYENVTNKSIAELVALQNRSKLSEVCGISEKRLAAIAVGAKPLIPELSLLELALDISLEELYAIYQRDFPDSSQKKEKQSNEI